MAKLELAGVTKRFGSTTAVAEIDLVIEDNEFFCIYGPPGCGKTTILRLLLGLETPDEGEIRIDGRTVNDVPAPDRNFAMVFQNLALFPHMTVRQNLSFPLKERKMARDVIERKVGEVAETLHITSLLDKLPAHLSGGERQRVAIGRSLVRDPNAYLMDEPISALDARLREEMRVELSRLQRELNHTLVYVTHDQEEALSVADRLCVMKAGRIAQIGTPQEIYNSPISRYVAEFVGSPPINLINGTFDAGKAEFRVEELGVALALAGELDQADGKAVIGVRPEDVIIERSEDGISAKIHEVEPLGAFTIIDIAAGEHKLRAQIPGQPQFELGEPVSVRFDLAKCHFFDDSTGQRFATGASLT